MARDSQRELLVVDGYNVIYKSPRYLARADDPQGQDGGDPFSQARDLLISDVAAYAQGRYEAVVVFDAAGNVSPERPNLSQAGVRVIYSETGESADTVIERIVTESRLAPRAVTVVTSDRTIQATVGGIPVTRVSSDVLVSNIGSMNAEVQGVMREEGHRRMTLEDRLDPATRAKLDRLLGRG